MHGKPDHHGPRLQQGKVLVLVHLVHDGPQGLRGEQLEHRPARAADGHHIAKGLALVPLIGKAGALPLGQGGPDPGLLPLGQLVRQVGQTLGLGPPASHAAAQGGALPVHHIGVGGAAIQVGAQHIGHGVLVQKAHHHAA